MLSILEAVVKVLMEEEMISGEEGLDKVKLLKGTDRTRPSASPVAPWSLL